jgi:hypothetical protein
MEKNVISKFKNEFTFEKKFNCFVSVEIDSRLWYVDKYIAKFAGLQDP